MIYYNFEKYLTKQDKKANQEQCRQLSIYPLFEDETFVDATAQNIYRVMEAAANQSEHPEVYLHTYQYKSNIEKVLAYGLSVGIDIKLNIESINEVLDLQHYDNLPTHCYRKVDKTNVYQYIREALENYAGEIAKVDSEVEYLREKNSTHTFFKVTEEIERFIRTWAPAYGLEIPRFHDIETTNEMYLPKNHSKVFEEIEASTTKVCEGLDENGRQVAWAYMPQKKLIKWDDTEHKNKRATPIAEIEALFDSLMFYRRNNIPMNDNYQLCPICGKPMRKNRYGITDLVEYEVCIDCDPNYNRTEETSSTSFQDYMQDTKGISHGHKITAEKNVLDA